MAFKEQGAQPQYAPQKLDDSFLVGYRNEVQNIYQWLRKILGIDREQPSTVTKNAQGLTDSIEWKDPAARSGAPAARTRTVQRNQGLAVTVTEQRPGVANRTFLVVRNLDNTINHVELA